MHVSPVVLAAMLVAATSAGLTVLSQEPQRGEIVHHHSLEAPFIHDWWQEGIPHWHVGGDAVVTDEFIRLTPQRASRFGWAWNTQQNDMPWWELRLKFFVRSRRNPGADGFALWYSDHMYREEKAGAVFGMPPFFKGIGIIFDSYDNDNMRDNPIVSLITNTNAEHNRWDTDRDLINDARFRCMFDFRNSGKNEPVEAVVTYHQRTLQLRLRTLNGRGGDTLCGQVSDLDLPPGWYFGMTATTGQVTDNHDIVGLTVRPVGDVVGNPYLPNVKHFDHAADSSEKDFWQPQERKEGADRASEGPKV